MPHDCFAGHTLKTGLVSSLLHREPSIWNTYPSMAVRNGAPFSVLGVVWMCHQSLFAQHLKILL